MNVGDHWRSLLKQPCPWSVDPPTSIREALLERIVGQEDALANITEVVQSWWDDSVSGRHRPLVLVFTGPTGVGKTEAAQAVARGLLRASTRTLDGVGSVPLGLLEFRGEHFMDESNVTRLRETLREEVAKALYVCAGHAVVVFDEVQKAHKPALTELLALMQGENSRIKGLDASRLVILFTSDTGLSVIDRLVEGGGGARRAPLPATASTSACAGSSTTSLRLRACPWAPGPATSYPSCPWGPLPCGLWWATTPTCPASPTT